ncbi:FMN-dependent dehydrogenase, includes L-lactate dehydrogenase and type II isopentenyl diphosphate isomerase [Natronincola peptidivorans]|uniref:L-lactate oxidase n=1 Tax=Natronincola peptidivorans TaxID=426128 RepID=A0A1I0FVV5_9FIRM|nr:alpha-hydroxy-acid oxidizing protein [Natronincola peptidivorans]SET62381.1 FMN-dependent dehydrogenase, includes L-lactate dehydrogenase and type II isopentenyl diphosphate isomerase [Natronincola peptidivorans]
MNYGEVLNNAKTIIGKKCRVCKECNGIACKGEVPGVGGKGTGLAFIRNREKINQVKLHLDTIVPEDKIDTSIELFGRTLKYPILAAPIGGLEMNYGTAQLDDFTYSQAIVGGCKDAGVIGLTADGVKDAFFQDPLKAVGENEGWGIPTIKPWKNDEILKKISQAEEKQVPAIAIDIDAAGLVILAMLGKPVTRKSVDELKEITSATKLPVILKGVMTVEGAKKALEAGAYGIVVSNHGGRVLDHTLATIEVLPQIAEAVKGKMKIFIDGGFRDGVDIFKALALGADAVLIGRPYAVAAYGGGREGVELYTQKVGQELKETMIMTGCNEIQDIGKHCVSYSF